MSLYYVNLRVLDPDPDGFILKAGGSDLTLKSLNLSVWQWGSEANPVDDKNWCGIFELGRYPSPGGDTGYVPIEKADPGSSASECVTIHGGGYNDIHTWTVRAGDSQNIELPDIVVPAGQGVSLYGSSVGEFTRTMYMTLWFEE